MEGETSPTKQAKLDDASAILVIPSDVLGETIPAITADGTLIRVHDAAVVEKRIIAAVHGPTMDANDVAAEATNAEATSQATVTLNPLAHVESGNAAASTSETAPGTTKASRKQKASTSSISAIEEERLLRHSDDEQSVAESVTQTMAWQITLEDVSRLIECLDQLDLENPEQIDELVFQRPLINEAAREVRDVPQSLPETLYRSAREARNRILQWQVKANRAVRQIGRWPSQDSLTSSASEATGVAGGIRRRAPELTEAERAAEAARRAEAEAEAERQRAAAAEIERARRYRLFLAKHTDMQVKLTLLREEATTIMQEGVPEFVDSIEELHKRAEPIIAAKLKAASEYPVGDLISVPAQSKKRRDRNESTPLVIDDDVVCTTPRRAVELLPHIYETADGTFVEASQTSDNAPRTPVIDLLTRLAIESDSSRSPALEHGDQSTNTVARATAVATSTPCSHVDNRSRVRSASTRESTPIAPRKRNSGALNFGNLNTPSDLIFIKEEKIETIAILSDSDGSCSPRPKKVKKRKIRADSVDSNDEFEQDGKKHVRTSDSQRSRTSTRSRASAPSPVRAQERDRALTRDRALKRNRALKRERSHSRDRASVLDSSSDSDTTSKSKQPKRRDSIRSQREGFFSEPSSPTQASDPRADLVPNLWEQDPDEGDQTMGGAVKTPKYHLPKWNGSVITYPDFIRAFRDFVHLRSDIFIPQKIQILENSLPKQIVAAFEQYEVSKVGYKSRLRYLDTRFGDQAAIRTAIWKQITDQPPARDNVRSIRDTRDSLVATVARYRKYVQPVNEEVLFTTVIEKFPPKAYTGYLRPSQRNVDQLFEAISDYVEIMRLSVNVEAVSPTREFADRRQTSKRSFERRDREKSYSRQNENKNIPFQPKGGKVYTTRSRQSNSDKSDSNRKRKHSPNRGKSLSGPHGPNNYPGNFIRILATPKKGCVFCDELHHSHLCTRLNTLELRRTYLQKAGLCTTCLMRHQRRVTHEGKVEHCRWFQCVSADHHSAPCPRAPYPMTEAKAAQWQTDLRRVKEELRRLREEEPGKSQNDSSNSSSEREKLSSSSLQNKVEKIENADFLMKNEHLQRKLTGVQQRSLPKLSKYLNFAAVAVASSHFLVFSATAENPVSQLKIPLSGFLDSGSPNCYINEQYALDVLKLSVLEVGRMTIEGIDGLQSQAVITFLVQLRIHLPRGGSDLLYAQTIPQVAADLPQADLQLLFQQFPNLKDENFAVLPKKHQIQLLIGNEIMWRYVRKIIDISPDIQLLSTDFGYMVGGYVQMEPYKVANAPMYFSTAKAVEHSWSLDVLGIESINPTEVEAETQALEQFYNTVTLKDGRYQVRWLYKIYPPPVGDNFNVAFKRLEGQMRKLKNNPEFFRLYDQYFKSLLEAEMIEYAPKEHGKTPVHYLAHKGVFDPSKSTPLRVVYDASATSKTSTISINDCMLKGQKLLPSLLEMLLHFRCHKVAVIADIRKAYHQIALHPDDRDVTRFLWVKDPNEPLTRENLIHFRFQRVPFGVITAPFLLNATLNHHFKTVDPEFHQQHINHIYVDNLITSVPTGAEGEKLYETANRIFGQVSMELAQWGTNDGRLRERFDPQRALGKPVIKVLGLYWDMQNDNIFLQPKVPKVAVFTKRSLLKVVSSYFDPLGWFAPGFVPARSFLKRLWLDKLSWDQPLPVEYQTIAQALVEDLKPCENFVFPRQYFEQGFDEENITLHVFVDASLTAYSFVMYLAYTPPGSTATYVTFLFGKARITPMTPLSVPKLELMAALLGSRGIRTVRRPLNLEKCTTILWADSKCTLAWILGKKLVPPFIYNRITEIRSVPGVEFRHVSSAENPADVGSRGCAVADLDKTLWWTGPSFLTGRMEEWPARFLTEEEQAEVDMTKESYWILRHALLCHSAIKQLLPKEWTPFYDYALSKRRARQERSVKRTFFTLNMSTLKTTVNMKIFTVKQPLGDTSIVGPVSKRLPLQKRKVPGSDSEPNFLQFPLHRFTHAPNGMPFNFKIEDYSDLSKMLRHFDYWCQVFSKFAQLLPKRLDKLAQFLSEKLDKKSALAAFIYTDQQIHFADLRRILCAENAPEFVVYQKYHFILDSQGIIRLRNYLPDTPNIRDILSPILLHPESFLMKLILMDIHVKQNHAGTAYAVAEYRKRFFTPKAQRVLPHVIRQECLQCKKSDARTYKYPENAAVPDYRLWAYSHPFTYTGVDIFGPFYVFDKFLPKTKSKNKDERIKKPTRADARKTVKKPVAPPSDEGDLVDSYLEQVQAAQTSPPYKKWVLIFTCLSTRAIYLISVSDLETETIWTAFSTFFADRATPKFILSDNAAQFRLLAKNLPYFWKQFTQSTAVKNFIFETGMTWHFTPAKAPWYGGVYERLIGAVKTAYYRTFGNHPVHVQTFQRTLKNLQVIVNERPLYPKPEGISHPPITPAHFLHANFGTFSISSIRPIDDGTDTAHAIIRLWKLDMAYLERIWHQWKNEYLIFLRDKVPKSTSSDYRTSEYQPQVGDIVVVTDFCTSPGRYKLAEITNLPLSADGKIRKADIRFPSGALSSRAIKALAPLELQTATQNLKKA